MKRNTIKSKAGFIMSMELMLIATVLVIGALVGMSVLQGALNEEMADLGNAVSDLNLAELLNSNYTATSTSFSLTFEDGSPMEIGL